MVASFSLAFAILAIGADATILSEGGGHTQCDVARTGTFDPIVYPGQPTAGHEHRFYGNKGIDESDTPDSLRAAPVEVMGNGVSEATTCGEFPDRAAYWHPTLFRSDSTRISNLTMTAYYKSGLQTVPDNFTVQPFPSGLTMIAGRATGNTDIHSVSWKCASATPGAPLDQLTPPNCSGWGTNAHVALEVTFPTCWDGNLSHLDYREGDPVKGAYMAYYLDNQGACPTGYSVKLPQLKATFEFNKQDGTGTYLSSDPTDPADPLYRSSKTGHADFMNGWLTAPVFPPNVETASRTQQLATCISFPAKDASVLRQKDTKAQADVPMCP